MDDKYLEAKKLFVKYGYSGYIMMRESFDNDFKKYMEYAVPKELQLEWAHEYQDELLKITYASKNNRQLLHNFTRFSTSISDNKEYGNLTRVIKLIQNIESKLDSFTKERIAEVFLRYIISVYIRRNIEYDEEITELEQIVVSWLNEIIEGPIHVDQSYFENTDEMDPSFPVELFEPEKIKQDARIVLKEWERNRVEYGNK